MSFSSLDFVLALASVDVTNLVEGRYIMYVQFLFRLLITLAPGLDLASVLRAIMLAICI